jgi:uncharacterized membrane-anchored protein YitT (DUF2179 family)
MGFIVKYKMFSASWFKAYAFILAGAILISIGYVFFITPHKIVPGGIYGISIILHHSFGTPVGLVALIFNIPLTILGIKVLGPRFGAKTITGFVLTSAFMDGLTYFFGARPLVPDDPLLSAIFGGFFIGMGVGLLFKAKATCGGTDLIAMMIGKWTGRPLGQLMMLVDSVIVLSGALVFTDYALPMYSLLAIFVMGKMIDAVLQGISYDKVVLIVSDCYEDIGKKITADLQRGGTFIESEGMYNGRRRKLIFTVLNRRDLATLHQFVYEIDQKAFITVMNADEILGRGFRSLSEKLD